MSADGLSTVVRNGAFVDTLVHAEVGVSVCGALLRLTRTARLCPYSSYDLFSLLGAGVMVVFRAIAGILTRTACGLQTAVWSVLFFFVVLAVFLLIEVNVACAKLFPSSLSSLHRHPPPSGGAHTWIVPNITYIISVRSWC